MIPFDNDPAARHGNGMNNQDIISLPPEDLHFIPLGGCQEFGLNFNLYAYGGKFLAVDCGIGFADDRHPGIDLLLPDPVFIEENARDLLGIVITHAHEDHVGAVPYLWARLKCPIYCTPFVASFLRRKCSEFDDVAGMVINEILPDQIIKIGPFTVGVIGVTHSTPSTISLTIDTPVGLVVHGNEWNLDPTPKVGGVTNREGFKIAGRKGVLAYVGDSTNSPFSGTSIGESKVEETLEQAFSTCNGRICVTMFASNIGRIISIARAAKKVGRQVCLAGRSLHNYTAVAQEHHMLRDIPELIDTRRAAGLPPNRVVYVVTGSQGEERAVMSRISNQDYRDIKLSSGDTVIFSARPIPGNERGISAIKSRLWGAGINVIDVHSHPTIHATGHPFREEVSEMIDWVRPKILIPIQGERLHLEAQVEIARGKQVPFTIVPENGSVIRLADTGAQEIGRVPVGILAVEPSRVIATSHPALVERRQLQGAGVLMVTAVINNTGRLAVPVQVSGIGLFDTQDSEDMIVMRDIARAVEGRLDDLRDDGRIEDQVVVLDELRIAARRVVNAALGVKPKVMMHVVRV